MFYKKSGMPEVGDIVMCTVKKVLFHSVFVELDEYHNKEGMMHISEIAPGRIRNIRDYVKEDKKIICKVLKIHTDKNHIELSLKIISMFPKHYGFCTRIRLDEYSAIYKNSQATITNNFNQIREKINKLNKE